MDPVAALLVEGEHQLGCYEAAVLRRRPAGWTATVPTVNILATNYRLVLWPQSRKPFPPASIPCTFIREAGDIITDQGRALRLRLDTGHRVYLLVAGDSGRALRGDIRRMVRPPRTTLAFAANVARDEIVRLIVFFDVGTRAAPRRRA